MYEPGLFEEDLRGRIRKDKNVKAADVLSAYHKSERLPQAIVKVSSWGKSRGRVTAHLDYISRHGDEKYPLETPEGDLIFGKEEQQELLEDWYRDMPSRKDARHSAHIMLSAPKGSDPQAALDAARATGKNVFGGKHDYVFAFHHKDVGHKADHKVEHPHVHFVVKARGYDGKQLRLGRKELHEIRKEFAKELRARGIMVEASYRNERGQGRKGQKQNVVNMRKRGVSLDIDKQLIEEVTREIKDENSKTSKYGKGDKKERPWEKKQAAAAQKMRNEYRQMATELEKSEDPKLKNVAKSIKDFSVSMPDPKTLKQEMKEHIANQLNKEKISQPDTPKPGIER